MALTPLDVHNKEFKKSFRGYSEDEVDEFLDEIVQEFDRLLKQNERLQWSIKENENSLEKFRTMEDSLQGALIMAQKAATEAKESAKQEGELIIRQAKMTAKEIVDSEQNRVHEIQGQYKEIQKQVMLVKSRLRSLLQSQLEVLDEFGGDGHQTPSPMIDSQEEPSKDEEPWSLR